MPVYLVNHTNMIVTDPGGRQCETFFVESSVSKCSIMWYGRRRWSIIDIKFPTDVKDILRKMENKQIIKDAAPFGDGHASGKTVEKINNIFLGIIWRQK